MAKLTKPMTRTEILADLAEKTDLTKKDVGNVLDGLGEIIEQHVKKRSVGSFTLPGLLKVKVVATPARKAKKNVPNPFNPVTAIAFELAAPTPTSCPLRRARSIHSPAASTKDGAGQIKPCPN